MANDLLVSGTNSPYAGQSYSATSNDKNTLSITSYFKLLAAQLQYQDMSNPMDNGEMMAQMTQMAMVQSLGAMTDSVSNQTAVSTQTYAAGLVGQEITVAVTDENVYGQPVPVGVKYGTVESVSFVAGVPIIKLEDDDMEYSLPYVLGMGKIPDPYATDGENGEDEGEDKGEIVAPDEKTAIKTFNTLKEAKPENSLIFSKHAEKRMSERGMVMDGQLMGVLEHAVEGAREKGAKDVAVIGRDGVFIANVPNNVIVTAIPKEEMKERIFTNIDSAVLF